MKKNVEVRGHKFTLRTWNYGEKQGALRAATTFNEDPKTREITPDVDPFKLNDHMLYVCLVEWDLTRENGDELPISIANIHQVEPPELIEDLIEICQKMNGITVEQRKK